MRKFATEVGTLVVELSGGEGARRIVGGGGR